MMDRPMNEHRIALAALKARQGLMVIYDPAAQEPYNKPWVRTPFTGCFGDRTDSPSRCSWIPPGCMPEWML
jgi:hypothetical protein